MAVTTTGSAFLAGFRTLSDTKSNYPTDAEVLLWMASAYRRLWDVYVEAGGEYMPWLSSYITTTSGTASYDLPAEFMSMLGVTIEYGQLQHRVIHRVPMGERARYENALGWGVTYPYGSTNRVGYFLRPRTGTNADQIMFAPTPTATYSVRIDYYPFPTVPTTTGSVFQIGNGWDEFMQAYCMWKYMLKSQQDAQGWLGQMQMEEQRVILAASSRDDGDPVVAADVEYGGNAGILPPPKSV
jgi:hypothetical protein